MNLKVESYWKGSMNQLEEGWLIKTAELLIFYFHLSGFSINDYILGTKLSDCEFLLMQSFNYVDKPNYYISCFILS